MLNVIHESESRRAKEIVHTYFGVLRNDFYVLQSIREKRNTNQTKMEERRIICKSKQCYNAASPTNAIAASLSFLHTTISIPNIDTTIFIIFVAELKKSKREEPLIQSVMTNSTYNIEGIKNAAR
ncbi:hypothetical protein AKJ16_DCAP03318 [Drosera capensis]